MSLPKRSYMDIYQELSPTEKARLIRRFLALRTIDAEPNSITGTPCWTSTSRNSDGYGLIRVGTRTLKAHRVAVVLRGLYDDPGLVAHHLCKRGADGCINPAHIAFITDGENTRLGTGLAARNAAKMFCERLHPILDGHPNTYVRSGGARGCRQCRRAAQRKSRAKLLTAQHAAAYDAAVARGETPDAVVIRMGSRTPSALPPLPAHLPPFDAEGVA